MLRHQRNPLQTFAIWTGLTLVVLPILVLLINPFNPNNLPVFVVALACWLTFCVARSSLIRWLGKSTALKLGGMLLLGIPIALVLAVNDTLQQIVYHLFFNNASWVILFAFLALWSLLSGLFTRSARGMYLAIHLCNWLLWLGLIVAMGYGSLPLLIVPLGIMLVLFGFSTSIMRVLESLPLFEKGRQTDAAPRPASFEEYEQGYRPSYNEGGSIYTYPNEEEIPTVYSPPREQQQQQ